MPDDRFERSIEFLIHFNIPGGYFNQRRRKARDLTREILMKIVLTRRDFLKAASAGALIASLPGLVWGQGVVGEARADSRPR